MDCIRKEDPKTREDLREFVSAFWDQCGLAIKRDCKFETSQGLIKIDVCAFGGANAPGPLYLCNCRTGSDPVPENGIRELKTLVQETKAHVGFMLCGTTPVEHTGNIPSTDPIRLLSWREFQDLFAEQWRGHRTDCVQQDAEDLRNYSDPLEPFVSDRLRKEPDIFRQQYQALSDKYMPMGMLAHKWNLPGTLLRGQDIFDAFDSPDAWHFMIKLCAMLKQGLREFDNLFGEKCRA